MSAPRYSFIVTVEQREKLPTRFGTREEWEKIIAHKLADTSAVVEVKARRNKKK